MHRSIGILSTSLALAGCSSQPLALRQNGQEKCTVMDTSFGNYVAETNNDQRAAVVKYIAHAVPYLPEVTITSDSISEAEISDWNQTVLRYNRELYAIRYSDVTRKGRAVMSKSAVCDPVRNLLPLAVTSSSVIFATPADRVTKFTNTCVHLVRGLTPDDALVYEYAIMRALESSELIAPRAYSLTMPSVPRSESEWGSDLRLRSKFLEKYPEELKKCVPLKASVRGIVEDKVGDSFSTYYSNEVRRQTGRLSLLKSILQVGISTIRLLEKLHRRGFIHGDMHAGNVAVRTVGSSDVSDMILIDFGYSVFYPSEIGSSEKAEMRRSLNRGLLSPWHLANYRIGRRDDVYRALEMIARKTSPRISKQMSELTDAKKIGELRKLKSVGNLFSNFCTKCTQSVKHANEAVSIIRSTAHVDSKPEYERIINALIAAKNSLKIA
jgi:hypothetical protein